MTGAIAVMASYGAFENPALPFDFYNPPQLVSASFNGTTQSLSSTNAAFTFTGDFTVEGWFRPTSVTGLRTLFTLGTSTFASGSYVLYSNAGGFFGQLYGATARNFSAGTMTTNTWYHVALVRSGDAINVYVNGVAGFGTDTQVGTIGNGALTIGFLAGGYGYFAGNMSNVRVAASAVYTTAFTTPTRPLSLTGAAFFAALGATPFVDSSTNAITVTNTGTIVLADLSPFPATWIDSVSSIIGVVAVRPNTASTSNPKYDPRFGGGIIIAETSQSYVDVPTARGVGGGFTISMAAVLPIAQGSHYVSIFDGSVLDRAGQYINARNWVGDGLEVGGQGVWAASNSTTNPSMQTLAWWDFVFNDRIVTVYKNGALVTMAGSDMGAGSGILGWKNPLRFAGDDSISAGNTMWPGTLYRMIHTKTALNSTAVTAQFNAVRATYGL